MRHMARRHMITGRLAMGLLVIEKYIRAVSAQKLRLAKTAQEDRLVDSDPPCPQCSDNPLVSGRSPRGDQRCSDGRVFSGERFLQLL